MEIAAGPQLIPTNHTTLCMYEPLLLCKAGLLTRESIEKLYTLYKGLIRTQKLILLQGKTVLLLRSNTTHPHDFLCSACW